MRSNRQRKMQQLTNCDMIGHRNLATLIRSQWEEAMPRLLHRICICVALLGATSAVAQPAELTIAARNGDLEAVRVLLTSGADPDPKGVATPLYFAAQGGHLEITEILIEHGADPNSLSKFGTSLHIAARRNEIDIAELLLSSGANPNAIGGDFDNTPLHEAAEKGAIEIARMLLANGANVNVRNSYREPAVHLAMRRGRIELANLLEASGASALSAAPISAALADANLELGRVKAVECSACHKLTKGDDGGTDGPLLWDIVGRQIAVLEHGYSDAMIAEAGDWTFERLNQFLADPTGSIPGTSMLRGYVDDPIERLNLIAYLRTLSDKPVPLP